MAKKKNKRREATPKEIQRAQKIAAANGYDFLNHLPKGRYLVDVGGTLSFYADGHETYQLSAGGAFKPTAHLHKIIMPQQLRLNDSFQDFLDGLPPGAGPLVDADLVIKGLGTEAVAVEFVPRLAPLSGITARQVALSFDKVFSLAELCETIQAAMDAPRIPVDVQPLTIVRIQAALKAYLCRAKALIVDEELLACISDKALFELAWLYRNNDKLAEVLYPPGDFQLQRDVDRLRFRCHKTVFYCNPDGTRVHCTVLAEECIRARFLQEHRDELKALVAQARAMKVRVGFHHRHLRLKGLTPLDAPQNQKFYYEDFSLEAVKTWLIALMQAREKKAAHLALVEAQYQSPHYGQLLPLAILKLIGANRPLTANTIINHLRGISRKQAKHLQPVAESGKLHLLTPQEIAREIEALRAAGLLAQTLAPQGYHYLSLTEKGQCLLECKYRGLLERSSQALTDWDWRHGLSEGRVPIESPADFLERKSFVVLHPSQVQQMAKRFATRWQDYLALRHAVAAPGTEKAYWRYVQQLFASAR
ncbi:MAG: hypothetical protein Q4C56_00805 [Peptococcaceae bacterium]|nr:hypothetical protein [Peptococcaceae bacterium]